jgi:transposase-like protein
VRERIPKTLIEAVAYFADERAAWTCVVNRRWPDGVVTCPRCQSDKVRLVESRMIWNCRGCKRQFSVKVGTIFEDSPLPFSKWLPAMWMICGAKNGVSSYELHRALGVTQKTAWFMLHRIRHAMQSGTIERLSGHVESDESFVGGLESNKHQHRKIGMGRGAVGKAVVWGAIQRGSRVVAKVVPDTKAVTLRSELFGSVERGSSLYTDRHDGYRGLGRVFSHGVVDHSVEYVNGLIHTNGMENFWSLLKRTLKGTYVHVAPFHLSRYVDEQAFRFNERRGSDSDRFVRALTKVAGRRLTYSALTGRDLVLA